MLDASVLGEEVHPQTFNTLKRLEDEDTVVIEEEEQFTELASSEVLLQQLRTFLDAGGREVVDSIPDGIHSGLHRAGAKGIFFYFRTKGDSKLQSFWKYYDLRTGNIIDNRHVIAALIACAYDTPRIVDQEIYKSVFEIQEKVLENLLQGQEQRAALQVAPQVIDPLQQTVATILQSFLNHPDVNRKRAIAAVAFLNGPMQNVQIAELRKLNRIYQQTSSVTELIAAIEAMGSAFGANARPGAEKGDAAVLSLKREDLQLICFDILSSS
jgi:hypothetical protein